MLTLPWLLTTLFILIGGYCSDWLWNKTKSIRYSRTYIIAIGQLISGLCFIPLVYETLSPSYSIFFISFGLAFGIMPISALYSLNSDLALRNAGTSQGIMSACLGIASFLAPAVTGLLTTAEGNYKMAILVIVVLSLSSALMLFGLHMQDESNGKSH
jgi:predicted MFS family arabinose efflux permease